MLLDVVEAEGENLEDDLKEDFGPISLILGFGCRIVVHTCVV